MSEKPIAIAVFGSRRYNNWTKFCEWMDRHFDIRAKSTDNWLIVTGCAAGADEMARRYATQRGIPLEVHKADWDGLGKKAGPIRNEEILRSMLRHCAEGRMVLGIAFGYGRGTSDMANRMLDGGISVLRIDSEQEES